MDSRGSGNHGILQQLIGLLIHNAAPFSKTLRIHWEDLIRSGQLIRPTLNLIRFRWILMPGQLNSHLQFSHRDGGKEQLLVLLFSEPAHHCAVWSRFS